MIKFPATVKMQVKNRNNERKTCSRGSSVNPSRMNGLIVILPPLILGVQLDFCNSNLIDHFGCDASPLLNIVCSDAQFVEQFVLIMAVLTLIVTLVCVFVSYTYIVKTILRLPSAQQRKKAFFTCSSHMIVISITYGSCIFIFIAQYLNHPFDEPFHLYTTE